MSRWKPFSITVGGFAGMFIQNGVIPPTVVGKPAGTRGAQEMLNQLNDPKNAWQKDQVSPEIISHLKRAAAGELSFDMNYVIREVGPLLTADQLSSLQQHLALHGIIVNVPEGWAPPSPPDQSTQQPPQPPQQQDTPSDKG